MFALFVKLCIHALKIGVCVRHILQLKMIEKTSTITYLSLSTIIHVQTFLFQLSVQQIKNPLNEFSRDHLIQPSVYSQVNAYYTQFADDATKV